jgi:hypothetical protein
VVNARLKSCAAVLALAALVLGAAAALRSAEYDEQYTLFLTAGTARPVWPEVPFAAGEVRLLQAGQAGLGAIARDLRATDVHPPLYFWAVALWRRMAGDGLLAARLLSVLCGLAALVAVAAIARRVAVPPALAMLLTLGCYGFAYTSTVARGFALAQALTLWGVVLLLAASRGRGRWVMGGMLLGAATFANYLAVFVAAGALAMAAVISARRKFDWRMVCTGRTLAMAGVDPAAPPVMAGLDPAIYRGTAPRIVARRRAAIDGRVKPGHDGGAPLQARPAVALVHAALGFLPFLAADFWFFVAQRGSRAGQFPPFHLTDATLRIARYAAANLFGGLPLYVSAPLQPAVAAVLALLALACTGLVAARWRHITRSPADRGLLGVAVAAPPIGLLLLGMAFHNTPIELRYLAFATPFAALLLAGALGSLPPRLRNAMLAVLLTVQAAALGGLIARPETMQPARATAAATARLARDGIVLLPRGNDGVGVVGAFAIESPLSQRLLVVDRDEPAGHILARIGDARRVVIAPLAQDDASRATLPAMRAALAGPCWRRIADGSNVAAFDRICEGDARWHSSTVSR